MFYRGQFVLCVKDFDKFRDGEIVPQKGKVYTIAEIIMDGDCFFYLEEIKNRSHNYYDGYGEVMFNSEAFRPLDDNKLEIFKQALKEVPADGVGIISVEPVFGDLN